MAKETHQALALCSISLLTASSLVSLGLEEVPRVFGHLLSISLCYLRDMKFILVRCYCLLLVHKRSQYRLEHNKGCRKPIKKATCNHFNVKQFFREFNWYVRWGCASHKSFGYLNQRYERDEINLCLKDNESAKKITCSVIFSHLFAHLFSFPRTDGCLENETLVARHDSE